MKLFNGIWNYVMIRRKSVIIETILKSLEDCLFTEKRMVFKLAIM